MLDLGEHRVDLEQHTVHVRGEARRLTPAEGKLLRYLADRAGRTVATDELLERVWGYSPSTRSRTVQVTVQRLRAKIEQDPKQPRFLLNVYGVGYRLQLPTAPTPHGLVGRTAELAALEGVDGAVVVLGPGGVGKSRLARAAMEASGEPWVQVSLSSCAGLDEVLLRLANALEHRSTTRPTPALLEALVAGAPARVVLDECEGAPAAATDLAQALVRAGRRVVLTSRVSLPPLCEHVLEPLPVDAAVELFLRCVESAAGHRPDPGEAAPVVTSVDCLPLAIELAAARTRTVPIAQLAQRLDWLCQPSGVARHRSLEACVEASWDLLSEEDQQVLGLCSVFQGGFDLPLIERVVGPGALAALDRLRAASMVHPSGLGRLQLLDTVHWFVAARAPADVGERGAAALLALDRDDEVANARALVEAVGPAATLALVERYRTAVLAMAPIPEVERWLGMGRAAARELNDDDAVLRLRRFSSHLRQWSGDTEGALAEAEAFEDAARAAGSERWWVVASRDRATYLRRLGRVEEAVEVATQAVERAAECPDDLHAQALAELGEALQAAGRCEAALPVLDRALALHMAAGDQHKEALRVGAKARALRTLGRPHAAIALYRRCLDLFRELGDAVNESIYLSNLGHALVDVERLDEASEAFAAGRVLSMERGDSVSLPFHILGEGRCARLAGEPEVAAAHLVTAVYRFEALSRPAGVANARAELALALLDQGATVEAHQEVEQAERVIRDHDLPADPVVGQARAALDGR